MNDAPVKDRSLADLTGQGGVPPSRSPAVGDDTLVRPRSFARMPQVPLPEGELTDLAICCPTVATFEGSRAGYKSYFGFDDKTNLVPQPGQDEYWIPADKEKELPANREQRDGARWVSVGVDRETQFEIDFLSSGGAGCIANCSYSFQPAGIAEIVGAKPASSGAVVRIRGLAAGETSVTVMCEGKLRGYIHIWCAVPARIGLDVVRISRKRTSLGTLSVRELENELRATLGQALIEFSIRDLGSVDLSNDPVFDSEESMYYSGDNFTFSPMSMEFIQRSADNAILSQQDLVSNKQGGSLAVYHYVSNAVSPDFRGKNFISGAVKSVGQPEVIAFTDDQYRLYNVIAHEIGHSLGLVHPNDESAEAVSRQYPSHLTASLHETRAPIPATNTEPAIAGGPAEFAVMGKDPLNLMGYWPNFGEAKPLRYRQWKACRRNV